MILSKYESGNGDDDGDGSVSSSNSQLLRDIEEIGRALCLHNTCQKSSISPPTQSSVKPTAVDYRFVPVSENYGRTISHKLRKLSPSAWNWKKPLRAFSHIRHRKFRCFFFLHVHSIHGLPESFDGVGLCVDFKRKDEVLKSQPSRVSKGNADFDDTLMHKCTVYGHRSGPQNTCKYEPKLFSVHASVLGTPGVEIGVHWVDLTRLLPLNFEELDGEKSSGKWTTSFKLSGEAKGATLNVSFGFSLVDETNLESCRNMTVSELINLSYNRPSTKRPEGRLAKNSSAEKLQRSGSVPGNLSCPPVIFSKSLDVMHHESFIDPAMELSKSIHLIYQKLDEDILKDTSGSDLSFENLKLLKAKSDIFPKPVDDEGDFMDFVVIDRGIEVPQSKPLNLVQDHVQTFNSAYQTSKIYEKLLGDDLVDEEGAKCDGLVSNSPKAGVVLGDNNSEKQTLCVKAIELESTVQNGLILDAANWDYSPALGHKKYEENYMEIKSSSKAKKTRGRSLSCGDICEYVVSDFLEMLEVDQSLSGSTFECDPESPRERLLQEFQREAFMSGNFLISFNATEEQMRCGKGALEGSASEDDSEGSVLTSVLQVAEEENDRSIQSLGCRRKVKMLEDLEAAVLMSEWGLDEKSFQNSPRYSFGGFGSPIELPPEEPLESHSLGEGFGPLIQMNGGGFLRAITPSLFRNAKNGMNLTIQFSRPMVLPAKMGSSNMEVLQHLASMGIQKLSRQISVVMPLEDITGRTLHQVACEAGPFTLWGALLQQEITLSQNLLGQFNSPIQDFVPLENMVPLAMDKIEVLTIEGLRIQCGMSTGGAPSSIVPHVEGPASPRTYTNLYELMSLEDVEGFQLYDVQDSGVDACALMDLSVSLDEWLRLDAGASDGNENEVGEHTRNILAVHHARCPDSFGEKSNIGMHPGKSSNLSGLLGDNLTVSFRLQLRDPLRNYEAVGNPMLALVHVERRVINPVSLERSNEVERDYMPGRKETADERSGEEKESISLFRINEVHLAGLDAGSGNKNLWGTIRQQQLGTRWLLASGLGSYSYSKHALSKSNAMLEFSPGVEKKMPLSDIFWSISPTAYGMESGLKMSGTLTSHVRNPNIPFLD